MANDSKNTFSITSAPFGTTKNGEAVTKYTITNSAGNFVSILDYGAIIQAISIKDKDGNPVDVVTGYDTIEEYERCDAYFGAFIGRVGNRIADSRFTINGKDYEVAANDGKNHLHGGIKGFDKYMYEVMVDDMYGAVNLTRTSADMEEGYPGNLKVAVTYVFDEFDRLFIYYLGLPDQDTIFNPTNHSYFNLNGSGSCLDHELQLFASAWCENRPDNVPTGRILDVTGTPMDFRTPKTLGQDIRADFDALKNANGYDHNYVIDPTYEGEERKNVGYLYSPKTDIKMYITTTMPGVQIYTGNFIPDSTGKGGVQYGPNCAVAIETQFYPDTIHHENFPSCIVKAGEMFKSFTTFEFSVGEEDGMEEELLF